MATSVNPADKMMVTPSSSSLCMVSDAGEACHRRTASALGCMVGEIRTLRENALLLGEKKQTNPKLVVFY